MPAPNNVFIINNKHFIRFLCVCDMYTYTHIYLFIYHLSIYHHHLSFNYLSIIYRSVCLCIYVSTIYLYVYLWACMYIPVYKWVFRDQRSILTTFLNFHHIKLDWPKDELNRSTCLHFLCAGVAYACFPAYISNGC